MRRRRVKTTKTPIISVIIPVYNSEKYIEKCLSSILSQTFADLEVIAVNDGSTDSSLRLMQKVALEHENLIVLDQENQGQAEARNAGLAVAKGDVIGFMDSDDYVSADYLEKMYNAMVQTGADIACCQYYLRFAKTGFVMREPYGCSGVFTKEEALQLLIRDQDLHHFTWNKLYKRSLFFDHDIRYPTMYFEDIATTPRLFFHAEKVVVVKDACYYYNQHSLSIMGSFSARKINDYIRSMAMLRSFLEKQGVYETYKESYLDYCKKVNSYCNYYIFRMHMGMKCMHGVYNNIRKATIAIKLYMDDECSPDLDYVNYGDVVSTPELEQNFST